MSLLDVSHSLGVDCCCRQGRPDLWITWLIRFQSVYCKPKSNNHNKLIHKLHCCVNI